jgi:hypothetical protein
LKIFLRDNNTTADRGAPNFWGSKIVWIQDFGNSRGTTACVSRLWWAGLVLISEALEVDLGPRGVLLIFLHRRLMSAFSLTARSFAMSRGEAGKPGGGLGRRQIALMCLERTPQAASDRWESACSREAARKDTAAGVNPRKRQLWFARDEQFN